jgi:hypothetical protein
MDKRAVRKVAKEARKWIQDLMKQKGYKKSTGFCAIATAKLYEMMKDDERFAEIKIVPVIIEQPFCSHAFLTLSTKTEKLLVDVTADQFSQEDVVFKEIEMRPFEDKDHPWFWGGVHPGQNKIKVFRGIQTFKRRVKGWESQSPQSYGLLN